MTIRWQPKPSGKPVAEPVNSPLMSQGLLRRMDQIDRELADVQHTGNSRWIVPYADLITLLLGLFMVLFVMAKTDNDKLAGHTQKLALEKQAVIKQLEIQSVQNQEIVTFLEEKLKEKSDSADKTGIPDITGTVAENPEDGLDMLSRMLNEKLATEGEIRISKEGRGVVISLRDSVLFDPGSAALDADARKRLDGIAETLRDVSHPIRVEGHTDNTPIQTSRYPSNWELSTARATTIVKYLLERHGYSPQGLSATGYGEYRPVAENSSIEGKRKNRRVDIVILNGTSARHEPMEMGSERDGRDRAEATEGFRADGQTDQTERHQAQGRKQRR